MFVGEDSRISGFHLTVGGGMMSLLELRPSSALVLVGNFSDILTDDCR